MKVLMIGGTGLISTKVTELAVKRGIDLYLLNRGKTEADIPKGVTSLIANIHDLEAVKEVIKPHFFDCIVQWIVFTPNDIRRDVALFKGHTKQYIFISSASAYQKPNQLLPITEAEVPLDNPFWTYSKNKQLCEETLLQYQSPDFNVTIIRPSHTYNDQSLVFQLQSRQHPFTMLNRMLKGKPIIIPDQGDTLWTLTYNEDFAHAFVDIFGNEQSYNDVFHLTSEIVYTWNEIYNHTAAALGVKLNAVHIPTSFILEHFNEFKGELLGDKNENSVFDNAKIKAIAPHYVSKTKYADKLKDIVTYYLNTPSLHTIDEAFDNRYDCLIDAYHRSSS